MNDPFGLIWNNALLGKPVRWFRSSQPIPAKLWFEIPFPRTPVQSEPMVNNAWSIEKRFREELDYIKRYVELLRMKSTLHDRQVVDLNRILERVRVSRLPTRPYDRIGETYTNDELAALVGAIRRAGPELYQTILGHEQALDNIPSFGLDSPAAPYIDRLSEWITYFLEQMSHDAEEDDEEEMLTLALAQATNVEEENDEEDRVSPDALKTLISLALEHARHAWLRQRIDAMIYAREQFDEIEVFARMAAPDAEINVLRQGFLLLMTAFDAAMFDLTRVAFRRRFFAVVGAFGKQEKVTLEDIGEAGSFETFQDKVIEEQLKKRYIKDLIGLLDALGIELVNREGGDRLVQLIEIVLRRNLHVHNRGVVDERYLEADAKTGKPKYNLCDLKLGASACIDEDYLSEAERLCEYSVTRLAAWASS